MQTQPLISLHTTPTPITYETAAGLAATAGGFLLTFRLNHWAWQQIGESVGQAYYEDPIWAQYSNPQSAYPYIHYAVEYNNVTTARGTSGDDSFMGTVGIDQAIRAGAGNDQYRGSGGGKVYLESGDDISYLCPTDNTVLQERSRIVTTVIYDGPGNDAIDGGIVRAAIDGDTDWFNDMTRVTYTDATTNIRLEYGVYSPYYGEGYGEAYIDGHGFDTLTHVREVVGGSGDDWLSGVSRIQGGAGDDYIAPASYGEGGDGNDTLVTSAIARVELRGGAGDDHLLLYNSAKASGGKGNDLFVFKNAVEVTINDLAAGDWVDLSELLSVSIPQAFDQGFLSSWIGGGYTYLSYDADGGDDELVALATFKGMFSDIGDYLIA